MTMPLRSGVTAPSFASAMSPGLRVRRCAKFRKLAELAGFVWDCTEARAQGGSGSGLRSPEPRGPRAHGSGVENEHGLGRAARSD